MTKYLNPKNYIRFILNKILTSLIPIISIWEKKYIKRYSAQGLKHQPIFIIGAPRTGSTILYQTLTNQLDVLYVDNLVCRFTQNFFFGFWLSDKLFKQKAHNCFKSNYGDTTKCGCHAPSECGSYWYRWLPTNKHFIDYSDITDDMVKEIRAEMTAVINYFDKPLVFKNLNAGQRLRLLSRCFPEAKFIFMKREIIFAAQSILKAKRKIGIADNEFWSVMPKNYKVLETLNLYKQIIHQIFYIEKQILEDSILFKSNNFLTIDYKDLGKEFDDTLNICKKFINVKDKKKFEIAEVKLTETISLNNTEIEKFINEIDKLDWKNYNDN
ncbi:MAG: hypothetical protein DRG78_05540 [Epsilonproteobacteria bacterium]|nr:MAG: hypothetical protein DRG78_05540 [Campylobacterota bacterium]